MRANKCHLVSGQTYRQEEEDEREVLQPEPILERVLCLPHRRNGHEEGRTRCHGNFHSHFIYRESWVEPKFIEPKPS